MITVAREENRNDTHTQCKGNVIPSVDETCITTAHNLQAITATVVDHH